MQPLSARPDINSSNARIEKFSPDVGQE